MSRTYTSKSASKTVAGTKTSSTTSTRGRGRGRGGTNPVAVRNTSTTTGGVDRGSEARIIGGGRPSGSRPTLNARGAKTDNNLTSVSNLSGRGAQSRARGTGYYSGRGKMSNPEHPAARQPPQLGQGSPETDRPPEQSQRNIRQDGFSVFSPNERKRQQITEQARREEEAYEQHKREKTTPAFSYVGTAGGGRSSELTVRQQQEREHRNAKFTSLDKQRKWKEEQKQREQSEIEQKRLKARKQAEQNVENKNIQEREQKEKWRHDMRRKNEEFLKRFESQATATQGQQSQSSGRRVQLSPSAGAATAMEKLKFQHDSPEDKRESERRTERPILSRVEDLYASSYYGVDTGSDDEAQEDLLLHEEEDTKPVGHGDDMLSCREDMSYEEEMLSQLQSMFPQYDGDYLLAMLCQADYSIENAIAFLTDS